MQMNRSTVNQCARILYLKGDLTFEDYKYGTVHSLANNLCCMQVENYVCYLAYFSYINVCSTINFNIQHSFDTPQGYCLLTVNICQRTNPYKFNNQIRLSKNKTNDLNNIISAWDKIELYNNVYELSLFK